MGSFKERLAQVLRDKIHEKEPTFLSDGTVLFRDKRYEKHRRKIIKSILHGLSHGIWLDLGCGEGVFSKMAAKNGIEVVSLDVKSVLVRTSSSLEKRIIPIVGSAGELPFKGDVFNAVTFLNVIEHLDSEDGLRCLKEIRRILKKGGNLLISTPNTFGLVSFYGRLIEKATNYKFCAWDPTHVKLYSPNEITTILCGLGFKIIDARGYFMIPELPIPKRINVLFDPLRFHSSSDPISRNFGFSLIVLARKA